MGREDKATFGLPGIFDNARDGLLLVRFPAQEIVLFNRAASEILGLAREAVLGQRLDAVFVDEQVILRAQASAQEPVGEWPGHDQTSLPTQGAKGELGDVEVNFYRVDDVGTGGPLVLLVVRRGAIAELASMARKGAKAQRRVDELERKARDMALFFSEAAHELNTPLTVVLLQSQLLRTALGSLEPRQEKALERITTNVHRLMLLSQDLMDLARADAGKLLLKPSEIDLADTAEQEVRNFRDLAREQDVALRWDPPPGPMLVTGEAARLRQVLANFLANALKFTPAGGRMDVHVEESGGNGWVVVRDNGRGMAPEDVARLFQPFVRIAAPELPKKPGTGLGLYLSKRIVEAHGGTVEASSPGPGLGMEFRFGVPLLADKGEEPQATGRPTREGRRTHARRAEPAAKTTGPGGSPEPAAKATHRKGRGAVRP